MFVYQIYDNLPCETAGLEQLRDKGIRELLVIEESSQCCLELFVSEVTLLLFMLLLLLLVFVMLPQFDVDALLLLNSLSIKR